jgi:hypothetical protein
MTLNYVLRQDVDQLLGIFTEALWELVNETMALSKGEDWAESYEGGTGVLSRDASAIIGIILNRDVWDEMFGQRLDRSTRTYLFEMKDWRNKFAHNSPFLPQDILRINDTAHRFFSSIGDPRASQFALFEPSIPVQLPIQSAKKTEKDIANLTYQYLLKNPGSTVREVSAAIGFEKSRVNSVLYAEENSRFLKSDSTPPTWYLHEKIN